MSTLLAVLVLAGLVAAVLRQLETNHARGAAPPWAGALGASASGDRDAERVRDDVRAAAERASSGVDVVRSWRPSFPRRARRRFAGARRAA